MCGFIRRVTDSPHVQALLSIIGLDELVIKPGDFRPYGILADILIENNGRYEPIDAIWWYALKRENETLKPNPDITSFNARDLGRPLWTEGMRARRGIVIADAIGESKPVKGTKRKDQYLMESAAGFILGALYKEWKTEAGPVYSASIITRPPHKRFIHYHEKSVPLFLPPEKEFLQTWLSKDVQSHPLIDQLINKPKLFYTLTVTKVKSFKSGEPIDVPEVLEADNG